MATKTTWAQRVLALLNLSEEGKVGLFENYAVKMYNKGIKQRKDMITRINAELDEYLERETEVLHELKEELNATAVTIDLTAIDTIADREEYFKAFDTRLSNALQRVDIQEATINATKASVSSQIKSLEEEIKILETKVAFFK